MLDPKALTEILALEQPGEPSFLARMIEAFRESAPVYVARMKAASEVGDHETIVGVAHALKGAAATLGAEHVRAIALDLELRGRHMSVAGAQEQLAALADALEQALAALTELALQATPRNQPQGT
jgi:HPt (histidine-containing phosphotransfer) domain-containing protein